VDGDEFAVFPQGAREKSSLFAPDPPPHPALVAGKRYLFKLSRRTYPDQFWAEVVAYRVGCLLDLSVPPAFVGVNSRTGECGALIEWFYDEGPDRLLHGGDLLQRVWPNFDRERGERHNLTDNARVLRALSDSTVFKLSNNPRQWWADALLFDSLIGNTDRHQENWGVIVRRDVAGVVSSRLTPLFDNGTSLGHERFPSLVATWTDADVERYLNRGTHHVRWSIGDNRQEQAALLAGVLNEWPETRQMTTARIAELTIGHIEDYNSDLLRIDCPVRLTDERFAFMHRLMAFRLRRIVGALT
jgi:hypothetical protein